MTVVMGRARGLAFWAVALALLAALIGPAALSVRAQDEVDLGSLEGEITYDGSSTVGPLTDAVTEEFNAEAENVEVAGGVSGTGGGFELFCNGETDLQNASRPIDEEEAAACAENGVDYYVFEVAFDGITVVVNEANDFLTCATVDGLASLWTSESPAQTFADLDPALPAETINLFGPGADSGTFDFFNEAILGDGDPREDYTPSEDDNVIVQSVAGDENALGYFGYAYFVENESELNAVAVDGGNGCVEPSVETIRDGTYAPLSRPLYVYVNAESMARPEVQEYVRFYVANAGTLAEEIGFVPSPDDVYAADAEKVEAAIAGEAEPDSAAVASPTA